MRRFLESRLMWTAMSLLLLWSLGRIALRGLARDPRFLAAPPARAAGPAWGGPRVMQPVVDRLQALGPLNLFDPRFEHRVRTALEEVPGVAKVRAVHRHWPRRYAVDVVLHRPVAVVRTAGSVLPVTADGVVLPYAPFAHAAAGLPWIRGLPEAPPALGARWRDLRLADALATLAQIEPYAEDLAPLELGGLDVSEAHDARRGVVIVGRRLAVRWGRPRARVGENPVSRKIAFLRIVAATPSAVHGLEVDVRLDDIYLRESPAHEASGAAAP